MEGKCMKNGWWKETILGHWLMVVGLGDSKPEKKKRQRIKFMAWKKLLWSAFQASTLRLPTNFQPSSSLCLFNLGHVHLFVFLQYLMNAMGVCCLVRAHQYHIRLGWSDIWPKPQFQGSMGLVRYMWDGLHIRGYKNIIKHPN